MAVSDKWNRAKWQKETAKDFQRMIRLEAAANDPDGCLYCCSCSTRGHWKNTDKSFDSGHLFSRRHANTLFCEANCWPQCVACNRFNYGRLNEYTIWFLDAFGREKYDALKKQSQVIRKPWTIAELRVMRAEYKRRWKAAETKLKQS